MNEYIYIWWICIVVIGYLAFKLGAVVGRHKEKMKLLRAIDHMNVGSDTKIALLLSFEAEIEAERYYSGKPIA